MFEIFIVSCVLISLLKLSVHIWKEIRPFAPSLTDCMTEHSWIQIFDREVFDPSEIFDHTWITLYIISVMIEIGAIETEIMKLFYVNWK